MSKGEIWKRVRAGAPVGLATGVAIGMPIGFSGGGALSAVLLGAATGFASAYLQGGAEISAGEKRIERGLPQLLGAPVILKAKMGVAVEPSALLAELEQLVPAVVPAKTTLRKRGTSELEWSTRMGFRRPAQQISAAVEIVGEGPARLTLESRPPLSTAVVDAGANAETVIAIVQALTARHPSVGSSVVYYDGIKDQRLPDNWISLLEK